MPRSVDIGTGLYGAGRYLSVWSMVAGYPRCQAPALVLGSADPAALAAAIAVNRAVAGIAARAEAVEAAGRLAVQDPPPETVMEANGDGEPVEVPNPAYVDWVAAGQLLSDTAADADLQHLLRTRADSLITDAGGVVEPGWTLALPPVPDMDPLTQTADWDGAAWTVRDLTVEEAAIWPLRPPPVPATVSRVQLRLALAARGLLDIVDSAVTLSGDMELVERWGAASMERTSPHLADMAADMGLSESDIDDIFREAAAL
ncbi:hypothetical protein [Niveispirillum cyanobacteriorum]|uniref:Uncharacterized protein n=1 Tax=Niveispirillum cyanobacteriorum TaxID=1612173 RepID=A0A2K9NFY9_9PROT|nr:hypothetical protein [Niveispirillum cyanobacteriorum]AUN31932.1 hypothetical protein C0V82_15995 [Niveispirillum cyanobacteriorum]GGE85655.1 hypothetical protein GCM10011317_48560 [Niveispirillum cyanobacteriorum]